MNKSRVIRRKNPATGLYYPNLVPLSAIRRYARHIAQRFRPDRIILFGSYAYGTPTPDSDVDLLVVMRTRNQVEQAARIRETLSDEGIEPGFAMDLLVRTPTILNGRLRMGDWFMKEIVIRGKVMYEKGHSRMARESRRRPRHRAETASW